MLTCRPCLTQKRGLYGGGGGGPALLTFNYKGLQIMNGFGKMGVVAGMGVSIHG